MITVTGKDPHGSVQDHLLRVSGSVTFDFGCAVVNLKLGFLVEGAGHVIDPRHPTFPRLNDDVIKTTALQPTDELDGNMPGHFIKCSNHKRVRKMGFENATSFHRLILVCIPRISLATENLQLVLFPFAAMPRFAWSSQTPPYVSQTAPHWSLCSVRIWTQPLLLCGPETQAGPFVPHDKRKKGGHGRRINLSPAQTTHLLVVLISCLSLLWFLLLSFLLSLVRAEDIGSGCTVNSQSRDTSLPPSPFFSPLAPVGHNRRYFC